MAIGNRFVLIDNQLLFSQGVLNVYYYKQVSGLAGDSSDLAQAWAAYLLDEITDIQSSSLTHVALATKNLDVPSDFDLAPIIPPLAGNNTGECLPPFVTFAFRFNRGTTAVRNGQKRYAGVPESGQADGVAVTAMLTALDALAVKLDDDLTGASGAVYEPVIMRKEFDPVTGITTYTDFPGTLFTYVRISSQNTRKFGRGA